MEEYKCPWCEKNIHGYVMYLMKQNRKIEVFSCYCGEKILYKFRSYKGYANVEKYKNYG